MKKLRVLDLFSGIGGFSLGLERTGGFETVAFCEIEDYPRKVLRKHWPKVPMFDDVRKLKGTDVGPVDVICGGYPCQPFSTAGKRGGQKDDRHLWPEFNRLVAELRPAWVIGENVAGHISLGLDDVLSDLEGQGYACRTFVIPACAVAAHHRRDRVWVVGHTSGAQKWCPESRSIRLAGGRVLQEKRRQQGANVSCGSGAHVADANAKRELQPQGSEQDQRRRACDGGQTLPNTNGRGPQGSGWPKRRQHSTAPENREINRVINDSKWPAEPGVGRMAHGVPNGVDRLKGLGNAVVPQIPEMIGHAILASMQTETEAAE